MPLFDAQPAYPTIADNKLVDVLRLIRSENVGPVTFHALLNRYGTAAAALDAIPELAMRGGKRHISLCDRACVEKEIEATEKYGARFILFGEADYPSYLMACEDAPPVLVVKGDANLWKQKTPVAIVGARNASAVGCQFAYKIANDLGRHNAVIISGLARGIDAAAHKGSLNGGTVGVIAGGIDTLYPPENEKLYAQMAEQGAIVSEQAFGMAPHARSFPARNRIISGMSRGTVIVEASFKSGSLITARFANEQGRDVFAVPGSPLDPRCKGTNDLIRNGAILTESAEDVVNALQPVRHMAEIITPSFQAAPSSLREEEVEDAREAIREKLGFTPVLVDELIAQCQVTASVALMVLLELELAGRLVRHRGGAVSLLTQD